jgi:YVTN family beta-propeller protein
MFDVSESKPKQVQVVQAPNTFCGLLFSSDGKRFFVSGGKDDNVHTFSRSAAGEWHEDGKAISLGHAYSLGFGLSKDPVDAGLALTPDGNTLVIANLDNDSASIVDVNTRQVRGEIDLRPGKENPLDTGIAGGEYPFWAAAKDNTHVYISSVRDREIDEIAFSGKPELVARIKLPGNPNKMLLNCDRSRLYVAQDNSDLVAVIETGTNKILESISTTAPQRMHTL